MGKLIDLTGGEGPYLTICECGFPIDINTDEKRAILSQLFVHNSSCISKGMIYNLRNAFKEIKKSMLEECLECDKIATCEPDTDVCTSNEYKGD